MTNATAVLHEMTRASDKGVPQDLLEKARCVVVVPGLKKIAFIGGGKYGRGFASCITSHGWSAPAAVRIEGGSFGLQLGASSTDVILLVMNEGGMTKLMSDKFTLGGEASAAAGPVGRNVSANSDVLMKAEILSYSRTRGVFAGLSLEGATLRPDGDENAAIYGQGISSQQILTGAEKRPAATSAFLLQLERFSGKGVPPVKRAKRATAGATASAAPGSASTTSSSPDNSRHNQDMATTADQQKNNTSDIGITRQIRRAVVADKTLSTYGHNVKIVTVGGTVTLTGPVRSDDEKAAINAKAVAVAGADHVVNQLEVAPPK